MERCQKCGLDLQTGIETCTCACKNCKNTVIDPVLVYCQSYLKNYTVAEVTKAVEMFFSIDDTNKARDILRKDFMEFLSELDISKIGSRRSSSNRSHVEATAHDVTEAVYLLIKEENGPRFILDDISKLPVLGPVLASPRDQSASILVMEKKLQRMEEKLCATDEVVRLHDRQIAEHEIASKSVGVGRNTNMNRPLPASDLPGYGSYTLPPPGPGFGGKTREDDRNVTCTRKDNNIGSEASSDHPCWSEVASQLKDGDSRWNTVSNRKSAGKSDKPAARKRPAPMQGTATDTLIKAGSGPSRDLWVYNVHRDMSDDDLQKYIEEGGSTKEKKINVRLWEARYEDHYEHKCFRLTIAKSDYDYVFSPGFWPLNVHFRKYWLNKKELEAIKNKGKPPTN